MGVVFTDRCQEMVPLVESLARRVGKRLPPGVDTSDLIQEGLLALLEAEQRYQSDRGVPLAAFAHRRIRGRMLDMLRGLDWASRHARRRARELSRSEQALTVELGRRPSRLELCGRLKIDLSTLERRRHEAANLKLEPLGTQPLAARKSCEPTLELREAMARLPHRERQLLGQHYFEGLRLQEIAERFGVSVARASQLHRAALNRLRTLLSREGASPETSLPSPARCPLQSSPPSPRPAFA